jgi:hypothetical protein
LEIGQRKGLSMVIPICKDFKFNENAAFAEPELHLVWLCVANL